MMTVERRVYILDDDEEVRRSLEQLLRAGEYEAQSFDSAESFLAAAPSLRHGCLLLDVKMPGINGLEVQAQLGRTGIRLPIIVITGEGDVPMAVRAMKAGAIDFLEKPLDDKHLFDAIETAFSKYSEVNLRAEAAQRIGSLTGRERQVLEGLAAGRATKVIAHDLGISARTVEVHRARMLERLGVRRGAEAIRIAILAAMA